MRRTVAAAHRAARAIETALGAGPRSDPPGMAVREFDSLDVRDGAPRLVLALLTDAAGGTMVAHEYFNAAPGAAMVALAGEGVVRAAMDAAFARVAGAGGG